MQFESKEIPAKTITGFSAFREDECPGGTYDFRCSGNIDSETGIRCELSREKTSDSITIWNWDTIQWLHGCLTQLIEKGSSSNATEDDLPGRR